MLVVHLLRLRTTLRGRFQFCEELLQILCGFGSDSVSPLLSFSNRQIEAFCLSWVFLLQSLQPGNLAVEHCHLSIELRQLLQLALLLHEICAEFLEYLVNLLFILGQHFRYLRYLRNRFLRSRKNGLLLRCGFTVIWSPL